MVEAVEREARRGRVVDAGRLASALATLESADFPERAERLVADQAKAVREKMAGGAKRLPAALVEWMRTQDAGFVALWEADRKKASRAKSTADRVAEHVARRSELGEIPAVDEAAIIARIKADPVWACWHYFPGWFWRPPSMLTERVIHLVWQVFLHGGSQAIGVIRGGGKSTITKALMILAGLCGMVRYAVVFGASAQATKQILKDITMQLEMNARLMEDFPSACIPLRALGGRAQRAASQSYRGERTYIEYGTDGIKLATIAGVACSGFKVLCKGIDAGFLGLVDNGVRPDFVLGDDIQSLEVSRSETSVASLEASVRQGFLGLGGKSNPLRIVQLVTCTREGDFSDRVLDPEIYPEYSGLRLGLVQNWGTREDLWEKYCELWRQDQRDGDKRFQSATAFYVENREAMDDGVEVTDPEFYVKELEVSTIQAAWNARVQMGEEAYFSQMENRPLSPSTTIYEISPKKVAGMINGMRRREVPEWATAVFAYADIGADKFNWSVVAYGSRIRSAVIDYGVYPEAGRIVRKNATKGEEMEAIWRAMGAVCDYWTKTIYQRQGKDVVAVRITAAGFDRGYNAEAVQAFCSRRSLGYPFPVVPLRGQGWSQWNPQNKSVIRHGWQTQMVRTVEGSAPGEYINVRTDFLKELVQRAFLCDSWEAPGACSLWGRDVRTHADYADSICSEVLADKGRGVKGAEFWRFVLRPGGRNHSFDSLVGCHALACFFGAIRPDDDFDGAAGAAPRRRGNETPQENDQARRGNSRAINTGWKQPTRRASVAIEE